MLQRVAVCALQCVCCIEFRCVGVKYRVRVLQCVCCSVCVAVRVLQCACCSVCVAVRVLQCVCCIGFRFAGVKYRVYSFDLGV